MIEMVLLLTLFLWIGMVLRSELTGEMDSPMWARFMVYVGLLFFSSVGMIIGIGTIYALTGLEMFHIL